MKKNIKVEKNFQDEESILDLVGLTPIVKLHSNRWKVSTEIFLKLEFFNPWFSIKDRAAKNMILTAEQNGMLSSDTPIVEATTGNTGISLAAIAAQRGYKLTIVMPEYVSRERMILLAMLGAEIKLTPAKMGYRGTVCYAQKVARESNAFYIDQSNNPANLQAHLETAQEIWEQMEGNIDIFIAGVGTGGHISGVGRYLRSKNPNIQIIAVEPEGAAVLSGRNNIYNARSTHGILGIGPGMIFSNTDRSVISEVFVTNKDDTYITARQIIKKEGILVGISSGSTVHASLCISQRPENAGKRILCMSASQTERYLSTELTDSAKRYVNSLKTSSNFII